MPEMVALLHSFVGLAAVLVGFSLQLHGHLPLAERIEVYIDVIIGSITATGSVLAFLKLRGSVSGKPLLLPARHFLNLAMLIGIVVLGVLYAREHETSRSASAPAIAGVLGFHLVAAIGGADMPVVVSMLNSYSGWTAAAAGFMLENDLLIVTGALVGSSGAILSLHHVPGDEPLDLERDLRRVRRGAAASRPARPAAASGRRPGDRRADARRDAARRAKNVDHRAGLRHGGRARAARGARADRGPARQGRQRAVRDPPGRRPPAGPHERAARRGQRARTTSCSRWTRSTTTSRPRTSRS